MKLSKNLELWSRYFSSDNGASDLSDYKFGEDRAWVIDVKTVVEEHLYQNINFLSCKLLATRLNPFSLLF